MSTYFDTSFLFSVYIEDTHSSRTFAQLAHLKRPFKIGSLLYFELRHSLHFAVARKGMPPEIGLGAISDLDNEIANGDVLLIPCDWELVHQTANRIDAQYTLQKGYRALDILHVATALALGAKEFLTFDQTQSQLAKAEGLRTL